MVMKKRWRSNDPTHAATGTAIKRVQEFNQLVQ